MSVGQRSTLRQRLFAFLVAGLGGLAAAAASFAMTVYDASNSRPTPTVAAGEPIDTGRWVITFRGARTGSVPPPGTEPSQPKTFLMVEFDLDNRSAATSNAFASMFDIDPPITDVQAPAFYLARDKWIASGVHPGIPEHMIAAWEWPKAQPLPQDLRLVVGSQIYKRRDNLYGGSGWFDRDPVAIVALPVKTEMVVGPGQ
ncbi:hypothetical protein NKH71_24875 [Mesorhizobium sp. M0983]|uniref:hypothetical protein n=1 Tax=Mesorhizobium sp. M0983 TaxID=2957040 RepID=UPI00333A6F15